MLVLVILLLLATGQCSLNYGGFITHSIYSINTTAGLAPMYQSNKVSSLELFIENADTGGNCSVNNYSAITILPVAGQCSRRVGINDRNPACALSVTGSVCITGNLTLNGVNGSFVWTSDYFGSTQTFTPSSGSGVDIAFVHTTARALTRTTTTLSSDYGNSRGTGAVDFQLSRASSNQVAGGSQSFLGNGNSNRLGTSASFGNIINGQQNTCLTTNCLLGTGILNIIQGNNYDVLLNGQSNNVQCSSSGCFIGTGTTNSLTGGQSVVLVGNSNSISGTFTALTAGQACSLGNGIGNIANGVNLNIQDSSNYNLLVGLNSKIWNTSSYNLVLGNNCQATKSNNVVIGDNNVVNPPGTNGQTAMQLFGFGLRGGVNVNLFTGFGQYNNINTGTYVGGEERVFTYGIGSSDVARANLFVVTNVGNFFTKGSYFNSASPGESTYFEHAKGLHLEPGTPVSLNDDGLIEECLPTEPLSCFGVTTEVGAAFVGQSYDEEWSGKYVRSVYRRDHMKTLSPKFDPEKTYVSRRARPEWHIVLRTGLVEIRLGTTTHPSWRRLPGKKNPPPVEGYCWWLIN